MSFFASLRIPRPTSGESPDIQVEGRATVSEGKGTFFSRNIGLTCFSYHEQVNAVNETASDGTGRLLFLLNGEDSGPSFVLLRKLGLQTVLTLSEEPLPLELLSKYQLQGELLPVTDFTAPTFDQAERAVAIIDGFLAQGLPVAVHCGAGLGRNGTILACYLASQGSTTREAVEQVRTKRPGSIETTAQEAVIEEYEQTRQGKQVQDSYPPQRLNISTTNFKKPYAKPRWPRNSRTCRGRRRREASMKNRYRDACRESRRVRAGWQGA